jgi:hypothetical protein
VAELFIGRFFISTQEQATWDDIPPFLDYTSQTHDEETGEKVAYDGIVVNNLIPEPSSVVMLALGAAGLAGWRLRRRHASR